MADSSKDAPDTGLSDADDTLTSDESTGDDWDADVSWDDGEQVDDAEDETEPEAATEDEDDDDATAFDDVEEDDTEESEEPAEEPEAETDDTPEVNAPKTPDAAQRKAAYEARKAAEAERAAQIAEEQEKYIAGDGDDSNEIERAVRELQVKDYNNTVKVNSANLTNAYNKAVNDFPILRSNDPVVQAEVDAAIDTFQGLHVSVDAYGNPVDVRDDLYAFLQTKANNLQRLTGLKAEKQKTAKAREQSKAIPVPTRRPKEPPKDADIDAFDEEVNSW